MGSSTVAGVVQGRLGVWIRMAIFLGLLFFLVFQYVDPPLIFHAHGEHLAFPIEGPTMDSFSGQPLVPGSTMVHLAARLAYYLHSPWLGTAWLVATAALLVLGAWAVMGSAQCRRSRFLIYLPAIILLSQYAHYCVVFWADHLAIILASLLASAVVLGTRKCPWLGLAVFAACSVIMYVLAAQGYLVFVALALLAGFLAYRRLAAGVAAVLWALALPGVLGRAYFLTDMSVAYRFLWPEDFQGHSAWVMLYASMAASFVVVGLACVVESWLRHKDKSGGKNAPTSTGARAMRWTLGTAVLLAVTGVVFAMDYQRDLATQYRVNYFALTRQWPELLAAARKLPPEKFTMSTCHDVDRALYHTGRLGDELFQWPQDPAVLLMTPQQRPTGQDMMFHHAKRAQVLYELGHVNQAERATCEAVELAQYHPEGLQRLAMIKAVKGQMAAARVYLQALSRDCVYRDWATHWLKAMETDPNLDNAEEVQRIRSRVLTEDSVRATTPLDLFTKNVHNQMAFDYLMALSLLARQPDVVSACLGYLDNFDYPKGQIPRHYAEAVLLYQSLSGKKIDLNGRIIDPQATLRFAEFLKELQGYQSDRQAAAKGLAADYGDTYYYYHLFGQPSWGDR